MATILVIEDDPQTRLNLTTILEMEGFDPLEAPNGKVGLEVAQKELPHLIICDVSMPELDGFGVLRGLRSHPPTSGIPLIFLTARTDREDQRWGWILAQTIFFSNQPAPVNCFPPLQRGCGDLKKVRVLRFVS